MELSRIADATVALAATRSRLAKRAIIAAVVRDTTVDDVEVTVSYLSGSLRQRRTGIGWRSMVGCRRQLPSRPSPSRRWTMRCPPRPS